MLAVKMMIGLRERAEESGLSMSIRRHQAMTVKN
jgi:hypothetical protein